MSWHGLADFIGMGGHGAVVWGAFGMCALAVCIETLQLGRARRRLRREACSTRPPGPPAGDGA